MRLVSGNGGGIVIVEDFGVADSVAWPAEQPIAVRQIARATPDCSTLRAAASLWSGHQTQVHIGLLD